MISLPPTILRPVLSIIHPTNILHDMAPGPQWLMIDADRGIDQATWLRECVQLATTTKALETSVRSVGVKIAKEFTAKFPRDVTFYDPKRKRMETSDEALERTAKREKVRRRFGYRRSCANKPLASLQVGV